MAGEGKRGGEVVAALGHVQGGAATLETTDLRADQGGLEEGEWIPSVCGMCVYGQCAGCRLARGLAREKLRAPVSQVQCVGIRGIANIP